jgi:mycothiol maleylpyruvate isomerase-like protein
MEFPFVEENTASRRRLEALTRGLGDGDLARTTPYGWTVAALLAHLAFWDQRVLALIRRWNAQGVDSSPIDSMAVNEALKPLCFALDPRGAVELCRSSAQAVDAALETISSELYDKIQDEIKASSTQFRFNRALHRNGHLDDIERLVTRPLVP